MNDYLHILFRSVVAYFVLLSFTRFMEKNRCYFDYIVGITIGSIAAVASIDKNINVFESCFYNDSDVIETLDILVLFKM